MKKTKEFSRRKFIQGATALGVAAGILSFPPGKETIEVLAQDVVQMTRAYPRVKVMKLRELLEGRPFNFSYPQESHKNFVVKLADSASWNRPLSESGRSISKS